MAAVKWLNDLKLNFKSFNIIYKLTGYYSNKISNENNQYIKTLAVKKMNEPFRLLQNKEER